MLSVFCTFVFRSFAMKGWVGVRLLDTAVGQHLHRLSLSYCPATTLCKTLIMPGGQSDGAKPRRSRLDLLCDAETDDPLPTTSRRGRRSCAPSPSPAASPAPSAAPSPTPSRGSSSRPTHYLLGRAASSLSTVKLPKRGPVLSRLLALSEPKTGKNRQISDALEQVVLEVKEVWALHTHPSWIFGSISEQIIMQDPDICDLLRDLYKTWYHLEYDSRRPRSSSKSFLKAKEDFEENMTLPFDIRKVTTYEQTMSSSGVLDWEEDLEYLKGQMTKEQPGCLSSIDQRQLQCDKRREERRRQEAARLEKEEQRRREEEEALYEGEEDDEDMLDVNDNDATYEDDRMRKRPKKIDVMGPIGQASDAKNLSVTQALTIAAATCNTLGVDLDETNISRTSAWRRRAQERVKKANAIKDDFVCPDKVICHWDGKTLRTRGRVKRNMVSVYISGLGRQPVRKLLDIPEAKSGGGADEFSIVSEAMEKWNVGEETIGMVFDTTASNTGKNNGCCR